MIDWCLKLALCSAIVGIAFILKWNLFFLAKKGVISLLPLFPFGSLHLCFTDTQTHPLSQSFSEKNSSQSSYNIIIGDVNMETVAFLLLNRVRLKKAWACAWSQRVCLQPPPSPTLPRKQKQRNHLLIVLLHKWANCPWGVVGV